MLKINLKETIKYMLINFLEACKQLLSLFKRRQLLNNNSLHQQNLCQIKTPFYLNEN